ncbi:MAG: DUF1178 family protein [Alphaproteobacteria bacterium]|nr:DUF1178 family protein [Alphaproteobacteria bacterium]
MIHFTLRCANGHSFDEWFMNSGEYERMASDGVLKCPECGDVSVTKGVMAPRLGSGGGGFEAEAPSCGMGGMGGCAGGMCGMGHNH